MSSPQSIASRGYVQGGAATGGSGGGTNPGGSTTTWTAVRQQMVAVVKALTPSSLSDIKYRATKTRDPDFRGYAEANAQSVLREYEIDMFTDELSGIQNYQIELRVVTGELVMAYHHHWGAYKTKETTNTWNERTLRALALEDRNVLDKAIGIRGGSNYVAAERSCIIGPSEFEEGDSLTFMVLPFEVTYFHNSN